MLMAMPLSAALTGSVVEASFVVKHDALLKSKDTGAFTAPVVGFQILFQPILTVA